MQPCMPSETSFLNVLSLSDPLSTDLGFGNLALDDGASERYLHRSIILTLLPALDGLACPTKDSTPSPLDDVTQHTTPSVGLRRRRRDG